ncbi:MAG: hypothetical protein Q4G54_09850 [Pelistega sp.]|nr:hypothetical protein [Pelistega sp.]
MSYPILLIFHLLLAIAFIGTVFVEVVMLSGMRHKVPKEMMRVVETEFGNRAVKIMPTVIILLYTFGILLAWQHRGALAQPFASSFGALLTLKILLAISIFAHFITAMVLRKKKRLNGRISARIHLSIFMHMITIVVLAKGMYYF